MKDKRGLNLNSKISLKQNINGYDARDKRRRR